MSSPTIRPGSTDESKAIADFVAAVRAQLGDLSPDEVTELTGGLEADLTDALAEAGSTPSSTPSQLYGDPAEYARELRAAAGLPPRGAGGARRVPGPGLAERLEQNLVVPARETIERGLANLDDKPWWPGIREFLIVLRPAWWVVRAWVAVESLLILVDSGGDTAAVRGGFGGLVLLLAVIVLSVQAGRRSPLRTTWHRVSMSAWNTVAVLLLLPVMFVSTGSQYDGDPIGFQGPAGLNLGDSPVTNVFPYDAEGRPLTGVQLYDQDGRPLETNEGDRTVWDDAGGQSYTLVPGSPAGQAPRWNAYPLQQRRDTETGEPGPVEPAPLPLTGVPPLLASPSATPTATGSVTGSAEPTVTAPEAASATPTPSGSSKATSKPTATK